MLRVVNLRHSNEVDNTTRGWRHVFTQWVIIASGVDSIDVGAVLQQSHKFPTYSPGGATVIDVIVVYNGSELLPIAKYDIYDCLVLNIKIKC